MKDVRREGGNEEYSQEIKLPFSSSAPLMASKKDQKHDGHYDIFGTMPS